MSGGPRFDRCMAFLRSPGVEGKFSNDPDDHGGATMMGVSTPTFESARRRGLIPDSVQTVRDLTEAQVETIYFHLYWAGTRAAEFPPPLDLLAFDAFVQHRPHPASEIIQTAVGAHVDGIIGPETLEVAHRCVPKVALERYRWAREKFYREIVHNDSRQQKYLNGWLHRLSALCSLASREIP